MGESKEDFQCSEPISAKPEIIFNCQQVNFLGTNLNGWFVIIYSQK